MAVTASITPGAVVTENSKITVSLLNQIANPTVDLSGSIQGLSLGNNAVYDANVNASAAIQFSKLATLNTGQILVGNAGVPTAADLSGDATIAADGAVTIANDAVTQAKIADDAVGADQIADGAVDGAAIAMTEDAQGDILYHNGTAYARLAAGTSGQLLQSGGTGANPSWVDQATQNPSVAQIEFNSGDDSTSGTFTVPSGVNRVKVSVQGGGGGGTSGSNGDGGGGAYFEKVLTVSSGDTISWVAGQQKTYVGLSGSSPSQGNSSSITYDSVTYTAGAGYDGYTDGRSGPAAAGVVSGTVDLGVSGQAGGDGGYAGNWLGLFGRGGINGNGKAGFVKFEY